MRCSDGWIDAGRDAIEERGVLRRQFRNLAECVERDVSDGMCADEDDRGPDFTWDEVPAALAGGEDIAFLWSPNWMGSTIPAGRLIGACVLATTDPAPGMYVSIGIEVV